MSEEPSQQALIARLKREVALRDGELAALRVVLKSSVRDLQSAVHELEFAEHELDDLRAIRDALTPPQLPRRPGMELASVFLPATTERVSGDFYLAAAGPQDATVLVVGDVVGHGLEAARRAAFVRTAFLATAPFSDEPARLLSWVNTALVERAGVGSEFVTAACVTYHPQERCLRWAYAGHPPALRLHDGQPLTAPEQGAPLGITDDPECIEGTHQSVDGEGLLLYTDGLTEARHGTEMLGIEAISDALAHLEQPSPAEVVEAITSHVAEFSSGALTDDLCLLAARMG